MQQQGSKKPGIAIKLNTFKKEILYGYYIEHNNR